MLLILIGGASLFITGKKHIPESEKLQDDTLKSLRIDISENP